VADQWQAQAMFRPRKRSVPPPRFWEPKRPAWRRAPRRILRAFLSLSVLLALVTLAYAYGRATRPPMTVEQVGDPFTRCGYGRGINCVIDGDTFKIGTRTIRVVGIDAAELAGKCQAEIAQAETSTRALQDWLNHGAFRMASDPREPTDKYGRELMTVSRVAADGGEERLADYMIREGGARRYAGEARSVWC
jgi:endonuclease YncB( thermonuclease family)